MNYDEYHMTIRDKIFYGGQFLLMAGVFAELFYHQPLFAIFAVALLPLWYRYKRRILGDRRKEKLLLQYKDSLRCVAGALAAGYSVENAYREAYQDMKNLYGEDALMCLELQYMLSRVALNEPIEQLLLDFAHRSGLEEVESFSQVFAFAKRMGGDQVNIIRRTSDQISERILAKQEITVLLSAKKLEQKVMNVIPLFILGYVQLTSPEFIAELYGNLAGGVVMTLALLVYGTAILLSEKIMKIEV